MARFGSAKIAEVRAWYTISWLVRHRAVTEVHEGELRACAEVMMKMEIDQNGELLLPSSQLLDRGSVALAELENWVPMRRSLAFWLCRISIFVTTC